jgi:hypothetical protein
LLARVAGALDFLEYRTTDAEKSDDHGKNEVTEIREASIFFQDGYCMTCPHILSKFSLLL